MPLVTDLTDVFVGLVQHYASLLHDGRVPQGEARTEFVARILEEYLPERERQLGGVFTVAEWLRERDILRGASSGGMRLSRPHSRGALAKLMELLRLDLRCRGARFFSNP
jgi:hypothetical protein